jgi:hypothetical protein
MLGTSIFEKGIKLENFETVENFHPLQRNLIGKFRNGGEFPTLEKRISPKNIETVENFHPISIANVKLISHHPACLNRRHPIWLMQFYVISYNSVGTSTREVGTARPSQIQSASPPLAKLGKTLVRTFI